MRPSSRTPISQQQAGPSRLTGRGKPSDGIGSIMARLGTRENGPPLGWSRNDPGSNEWMLRDPLH